jgi:hypothetical protein
MRTTHHTPMHLTDCYLPEFQFRECHQRQVAASPQQVMAAVQRYQPDQDVIFRALIALRELPARLLRRAPAAPFGLHNFTRLAQRPDRELAYGLIGRFWQPDYGLVDCADGDAFRDFREAGTPKLLLGFMAQAGTRGRTNLMTETRVWCSDRASQLRFAPYWYLIRPVSGLIRRRILAAIARDSGTEPQDR